MEIEPDLKTSNYTWKSQKVTIDDEWLIGKNIVFTDIGSKGGWVVQAISKNFNEFNFGK